MVKPVVKRNSKGAFVRPLHIQKASIKDVKPVIKKSKKQKSSQTANGAFVKPLHTQKASIKDVKPVIKKSKKQKSSQTSKRAFLRPHHTQKASIKDVEPVIKKSKEQKLYQNSNGAFVRTLQNLQKIRNNHRKMIITCTAFLEAWNRRKNGSGRQIKLNIQPERWLIQNMLDQAKLPEDLFFTFLEYIIYQKEHLRKDAREKALTAIKRAVNSADVDNQEIERAHRILKYFNFFTNCSY